jgi:hypothetical protein
VASVVFDMQCGLHCFAENVLHIDDPARLQPARAVVCIWGTDPRFNAHPFDQQPGPEYHALMRAIASAHQTLMAGQCLHGQTFSEVWAAAGRPDIDSVPQYVPPVVHQFTHLREDQSYQAASGATSSAAVMAQAQEMVALYEAVALAFGGLLQGDSSRISDVMEESAAVLREWEPGMAFYNR